MILGFLSSDILPRFKRLCNDLKIILSDRNLPENIDVLNLVTQGFNDSLF
jgi:hypothetical protein